jgi:predicted ester cyclase
MEKCMSVETSKALVRRWFGEMVNGQTDLTVLMTALDETMAADFVDHDGPDASNGREALRRALPVLLKALPGAHFTIEHLIGEGDFIAVLLRGQATHTGEILGIPRTGKRIIWTEKEQYRLANGRIVESWGEGGLDEVLAEIGLAFKGSQT